MLSCHPSNSTTNFEMLGQIFFPIRMFHLEFRHSRPKFRCVIDQIGPNLAASSSLGSLFTSVAAAAAGSSAHATVTSTITQVAVTAVAIASGACLSTKVDFSWPKSEELSSPPLILDGVDVTGYSIFNDQKVQNAVSFARKAHYGQLRRTGEPYLTHCLHTGRILAMLVPPSGQRAVDTVVAGILHDVVDDTSESLMGIREKFGNDVVQMVAGVSRLSYINQLLRRHRRINANQGSLSHDEANNLRVMLLGMVDDPRVVLIKLADRLHNMRTIYALPLSKAESVAKETLVVWCSLASRLGLWALKAELEDLCFAVLQPRMFRQMRAQLASMWSPCRKTRNLRRVSTRSSLLPGSDTAASSICYLPEEDDIEMKDLLEAVLPFEVLLDREKRTKFLSSMPSCSTIPIEPKQKVVRDAGIAVAALAICEEALEHELRISTSYVPGMEVTLYSRLKSLYSIYSKMERKDVDISQVYDARALRVVIGDQNGTLRGPAVQCCYNVLDILHKLWSPIDGEFDDYIVNPKPSGYQSLHTAVQGPDSSPLEVQIRTQRMHEYAEHGLAAHWLYKETYNKSLSTVILDSSHVKGFPTFSQGLEERNIEDDTFFKYNSLKAGHPVLRVEGSNLLTAVIISVDKDGKELLVAVSFGLAASEAIADRRGSFQVKRWEAYARLYKKVFIKGWFEPGHGDWFTCLEKYTLCRDGIYHKQDHFDRLLPTFIQIIDLEEQEESKYWEVVSAVFEGKHVDSIASCLGSNEKPISSPFSSPSMEATINNKVRLLRTMLQWEEQICSEVGFKQSYVDNKNGDPMLLGEVVVVYWPEGDIIRLKNGSTVADVARRLGHEGNLVLVNGQLVQPDIQLRDGDVVQVTH